MRGRDGGRENADEQLLLALDIQAGLSSPCEDDSSPNVATVDHPPEVDRVNQQPDYDHLQQKRHLRLPGFAPPPLITQARGAEFRAGNRLRY